ncbi:MAG TPA: transaldolase [Solirubrobacteraceae bacterium]|jgi:transaldolase|nr:transaldolase [Solirubrobacteraceae bacterium]
MSTTEATNVNARLKSLVEAGVSPWLDYLQRSLITGGELQRLIDEDSLRGNTSNPSIFEKAILGSEDYDDDLRELAGQDLDPQAIYEHLAIKDVQLACDVHRPTWDASNHQDGFVSLEVSADMAHDEQKSIAGARDFWKRVNRPNVMIKIPGTPEGLGAIQQGIYEGININITLLFGVEAYEKVIDAYLTGLERRLAEGKPLDVASVASFFVSRVDTAVDKRLEAIGGHDDLLGTAAVANARLAYRKFEEHFSGPRWEALHHAGAHYQRPLWASTGTKNEKYSDTKYVDELVGPHTVNTMPLNTLQAFADHGHLSGPTAQHDPTGTLEALAKAGIDMTEVTEELLKDGVDQFVDAMNRLLAGIEKEAAKK